MKNKWLLFVPIVGIIYVFIFGVKNGFLSELPIEWYTALLSSSIQGISMSILLILLII